MKKIGAAVLLTALIIFGAPVAKAVSLKDLQDTVKSLQQQVGSLQSQLGLTLTALTNSSAPVSNAIPVTPVVTPPTGGATLSAGSAYNTASSSSANVTSAPAPKPITPARLGASGANVTAIQKALIATGYLSTSATGYYGPATAAAVEAFQEDNGLAVVGSVGPATAGLLYSTLTEGTYVARSDLPATPTGTISVTRNMTYGDQYVPALTTHEKIGSYVVHNGTTESVKLNSLLIGFTTGGTGSVSNLTHMQASVNGISTGVTLATVGTYNTMVASTVITSGATAIVDLYADMGTATSGGIRSNLLAGALGLTSGHTYNSGSSYSGQDIESTTGTAGLCTLTSFTASPTTVAPSGASMLSWNTSNCTSVSVTGGSVLSTLLSGSVTTGALTTTTNYTLTAHGMTGAPVTSSLTVAVSSAGNLVVTKNASYPNQTIAPVTINAKLASYMVQNTTTEPVTINNVHIFPSGTVPLYQLTNFRIYVNGVQVGPTIAPTTDNHVSPSYVVAAGSFTTVDVYADVNAPLGSGTIITSATVNGTGVTSSTLYPTGTTTPVVGQTTTVSSSCTVTPTFNTGASSVAQYIASAAPGATDATQAVFTLTSPTASIVNELKLKVVGPTAASSARIGTTAVPFVSGVAYFTGLSIAVPAGGSGTNVTVYLSYPTVGLTGLASGTTSTVSLTYIKFACGGTSNTATVALSAPTMTLVGSRPLLTVVDSSDPLINGLVKIGSVTVSADVHGAIAVNKMKLLFTSSGAATIPSATNNIVVKVGGITIPTTNTTLALSAGGTASSTLTFSGSAYSITGGTTTTFDMYVTAATVAPTNMLTMTLGTSSGFIWTDTAGSGVASAQNGTLIYNYPTNVSTIVAGGTGSCAITSFYGTPTSISAGGSATLIWNTTGCVSASVINGTFSTTVPVVGSASTGPLTATTTFTLSALGTTGGAVTATTTITILGSGCSIAPTFSSYLSTGSQYVATGTTTGVTDATQAVYNLYTSSTGVTVNELKVSVSGSSTAVSARVGTVTAPFVAGTAYLTGLSIPITSGAGGTNVTVFLSYPPVGPGGIASGTHSTASLTSIKFFCGGASLTSTHSVPAATMTLVATKPSVTASAPSPVLPLAIGTVEVIDVTVTASAGGNLRLNSLPFSLGGGGYTYNGVANSLVVKNSAGAVIPTTNTAFPISMLIPTTITFTGGYVIPAGTSAVFKIYVPVTSVVLPHPMSMLQAAIFSPVSSFNWTDISGGATYSGVTFLSAYPSLFHADLYN